jgi:hypothetical protein
MTILMKYSEKQTKDKVNISYLLLMYSCLKHLEITTFFYSSFPFACDRANTLGIKGREEVVE